MLERLWLPALQRLHCESFSGGKNGGEHPFSWEGVVPEKRLRVHQPTSKPKKKVKGEKESFVPMPRI